MADLPPDAVVGANLRAEQGRSHVQNVDLAEQLGVSRMTVHRWRTGTASMTVAQVAAAADVLGCDVPRLLDGVEPTPAPRRAVPA